MRRDARRLLEKLSRKELRYREFEDAFPDTELWPIFEVILRDERVVGEGVANLPDKRAVPPPVEDHVPPPPAPTPLFERYNAAQAAPKVPPTAAPAKGVDLREFFSRLGDAD
ncbi:MAG: hypothetical protein ABW184_02055 [Sphingobium sp.]